MHDHDADATPSGEDPLAELADLVLNVGRLIRARTPSGADAVPLTETERTVMRIVDLFPSSSPSVIASRSRIQRTNVSAALRSLENKGMITRTSSSGRGISVMPTALAASNLRHLRTAWSRQLSPALGDDLASVRHCVELLALLERALIAEA
jgi:DNA-binding MarR family transcriptional regulator